jgi:hypothetical protein
MLTGSVQTRTQPHEEHPKPAPQEAEFPQKTTTTQDSAKATAEAHGRLTTSPAQQAEQVRPRFPSHETPRTCI